MLHTPAQGADVQWNFVGFERQEQGLAHEVAVPFVEGEAIHGGAEVTLVVHHAEVLEVEAFPGCRVQDGEVRVNGELPGLSRVPKFQRALVPVGDAVLVEPVRDDEFRLGAHPFAALGHIVGVVLSEALPRVLFAEPAFQEHVCRFPEGVDQRLPVVRELWVNVFPKLCRICF